MRAYPSEGGVSVFFQDVNDRKRAEGERERLLAEAQERAEHEALLHRISEAIRATTDAEEIQGVAARALGEALRADRFGHRAVLAVPFFDEGLDASELAERLALNLIAGVDAAAEGGVMRDDVCLLVAAVED